MTDKDKRAWMARYIEAEMEIERLTESIKRWASRAQRVTQGWGVVSGRGDGVPVMVRAVEEIELLQGRLVGRIQAADGLQREIEEAIDVLPDERCRTLLRQRYLRGLNWDRIAREMCYSYRQVLRIHEEALGLLDCAGGGDGETETEGGTLCHTQTG